MDIDSLSRLIEDAERRIGSFIACGGKVEDTYVQKQIRKIELWSNKITELIVG